VVYFKVLSQHWPVGTKETTKKLSQYRRSLGRDLNPGPPEYDEPCSDPIQSTHALTLLSLT
jgi:hypothetical protein